MKIAVIGGGPSGLLFSAIAARTIPGAEVDLFERNPATTAFGFGVVFSDATQKGVDTADSALRNTLDEHGERWEELEVRLKGETFTFGGNGMGAVLRRDLLANLEEGASSAGARLHFDSPVSLADLDDYDIVVAADGANSQVRAAIGDAALGVSYEVATAKFIWFATPHPFDGLTFVHADADIPGVAGVFAAHAYPIGKGLSTFIVETDEATWAAAGMDAFDPATPPGPSDEHSQHLLEKIFASAIDGAPLIGNNSRWSNFRTIRAKRWHAGNVVFLGDAVHTAHFSVGSGTKMALEDAIALADALRATPDDISAAFTAYEHARQPLVRRIQDSARPSLSWWEHFGEYYHQLEPWQFAIHFFSRALPLAKIGRRDPAAPALARESWRLRFGSSPLEAPITIEASDGTAAELPGRWVDLTDLPPLDVVEAPAREADVAGAVREAFAGAAPRTVIVRGGTPLTRQLVAEAARFRHEAVAIIFDPESDEDRAETLILSGRADVVAR